MNLFQASSAYFALGGFHDYQIMIEKGCNVVNGWCDDGGEDGRIFKGAFARYALCIKVLYLIFRFLLVCLLFVVCCLLFIVFFDTCNDFPVFFCWLIILSIDFFFSIKKYRSLRYLFFYP